LNIAVEEIMLPFLTRLRLAEAQAELAEHTSDHWRAKLEDALRGLEFISTAAALDLLREKATTSNARRLAKNMRSLGFVPIKSRRLMPGGYRDTVTRGWARPFRQDGRQTSLKEGGTVGNCHPRTSMNKQTQLKDPCHVQ
jgi:hypothetical protein